MKLLTRKHKAKEAAQSWKSRYFRCGVWMSSDNKLVYDNLIALGPDPDPDDVNTVIGNTSWTEIICSCCGGQVDICAVLREADWDKQEIRLCLTCATEARQKIGEELT